MSQLIACLDQIALMRQQRPATEPDPVAAAVLAELAGADGISVSLRNEQSDQERDARLLRATLKGSLQVRLSPSPECIRIVTPVRPDSVMLVPARSEGLGTEAGFDLSVGAGMVAEAANALGEAGLPVLALVAAEKEQVKAAHRLGLSGVALVGNRLEAACGGDRLKAELESISDCARLARKLGLRVHVAQGLGLASLRALATLSDIDAVEVGHALCARALLVGMDRAVRDFRAASEGTRA